MKDAPNREVALQDGILPDALHSVTFCLNQVLKDKTHVVEDQIVDGLTFEELLGALLAAEAALDDDDGLEDAYCEALEKDD